MIRPDLEKSAPNCVKKVGQQEQDDESIKSSAPAWENSRVGDGNERPLPFSALHEMEIVRIPVQYLFADGFAGRCMMKIRKRDSWGGRK